jgi:hypothetical protein
MFVFPFVHVLVRSSHWRWLLFQGFKIFLQCPKHLMDFVLQQKPLLLPQPFFLVSGRNSFARRTQVLTHHLKGASFSENISPLSPAFTSD